MSISLRKAIDYKCRECIHDPLSGNGSWRQQTEACQIRDCPLWPVRPRSKPNKERGSAFVHTADCKCPRCCAARAAERGVLLAQTEQ